MTDFYKSNGSYYTADTNQKILNLNDLQSYAKAGGKEISAPVAKTGSVAIPNPTAIKDYNVTNSIGGTLYGTLKTPTSNDISTGIDAGSVTPPATTAGVVHQNFINNANQFTDQQKGIFDIYETQRKEAQTKIDAANKAQADNQTAIDQNATDIKNNYSADINDTSVQGWRQKALGITAEDLQTKYNSEKTLIDQNLQYGEEIKSLTNMMQNEVTGNKNTVGTASVMTGRENTIKEDWAGRIGVLQAGVAVNNGNISLAQTFIDNAVTTVNADRTDRLNYLNFYKGLLDTKSADNKTALLTATTDEKTALDSEIKMLTDKIAETETNKKTIMSLLTDTQTSQTAIKAGVNVTDTPEKAVQKMTDYIKAHPEQFDNGKVTYGKTGTDESGNDVYGFIDTGTKTITTTGNNTSSSGVVTTSTGAAYDIASYATDPNHETSVQNILNTIGQFKTVSDIDTYIKKVAPNSPITGAMVVNAASKYGVSWEMMVAIMQQDSNLGTAGKGARTFNPGNVGNTDSGAEVNYKTWQAGVDAVAQNLAGRKKEQSSVDYKQYGLLANTDFNPTNDIDKKARMYLDYYIKNAAIPSSYQIGMGRSASSASIYSKVAQRANDLYYAATGSSLPDVNILKNNKTLINGNNKLLNQLNIQEGTVGKNFKLAVDNLEKGNINQNSQPINAFLNAIKNAMGDPDVAQYLTQNGTLQNEVGSLIAIKNASGTTVADKLASAGLIPQNASEAQQKQILKILLQEAENGALTINETNAELYKQIDPLEQSTQNPNRQNTLNPVSTIGSDLSNNYRQKYGY